MSQDEQTGDDAGDPGELAASAHVENGEIVVTLTTPPSLSDLPVRIAGAERYAFDSVPPLQEVELASLENNRYHVREDPATQLPDELIREVEEHGHPSKFPVARPRSDGGYELLDGHERVGIARRIGLSKLPVHVLDLDPWEGTKYWIDAHIPHPDDVYASDFGFYDDEEVAAAVEHLRTDWSRERLERVERLRRLL